METSEFFFFVDSLLSKEVPRPKGCDVEFKPPSCPAGGFAKPPKDCWALKCFLHPLNRAQQCPSPHPREDRNGERQGKRVSICGLWIFWDILKCPKGTHIHRADLNIPGNAPGWKPEWEVCWGPAWPLCATVWNNSQFRPFNASLRDVLTGRAFEGHLVHISLHPGSLSHIYVFTLCLLVQEGGGKASKVS